MLDPRVRHTLLIRFKYRYEDLLDYPTPIRLRKSGDRDECGEYLIIGTPKPSSLGRKWNQGFEPRIEVQLLDNLPRVVTATLFTHRTHEVHERERLNVAEHVYSTWVTDPSAPTKIALMPVLDFARAGSLSHNRLNCCMSGSAML